MIIRRRVVCHSHETWLRSGWCHREDSGNRRTTTRRGICNHDRITSCRGKVRRCDRDRELACADISRGMRDTIEGHCGRGQEPGSINGECLWRSTNRQ